LVEAAVPDSWEKYEGRGVSIWLPSSFQGGNLEEDVNMIAAKLADLGSDFETIAQIIEQEPSLFVFWAFDSEIGDAQFLTNVNIVTEEVPSAVDLAMYLDLTTNQLPDNFSVVEREMVSFQDTQAGRLVIEFAISAIEGKEVLYIIKRDYTIWVVTYATSVDEFDRRQLDFEQSIGTFEATLD